MDEKTNLFRPKIIMFHQSWKLGLVVAKDVVHISKATMAFRMGRLKTQYLRRSPIIRVHPDDGTVNVEGVSNKQYPLPVPWLAPKPISRVNPGPKGSGDLRGLPEVDMTRLQPGLASSCKALQNASDEVKRIFSLEMGRRKQVVETIKTDVRYKVAEHKLDRDSLVVQIAEVTVSIRNMQQYLASLVKRSKLDQPTKHRLFKLVNHRRFMLGHLREMDYKRYEWLLEELDLVYKPRPFQHEEVIRRKHTERLVDLWCDEQRRFNLEMYKDELEQEQAGFLRQKAEDLEWMMKQQQELQGSDPDCSVIQQQKKDIQACLDKAAEIEQGRMKGGKEEVEEYHIFAEEEVKPEHIFLN